MVSNAGILNAFTVDLEDWFCVGNMENIFPVSTWPEQTIRLERPVNCLLELLKQHKVRATFFVLGWIAERCPELVRKIYDAGHEIGLHSYEHKRLTSMNRETFEADFTRTINLVSGILPRKSIVGYRAPSFSIMEKTSWALESLASFGLRYDSSIMPFSGHPDYGWKNIPQNIHRLDNGILEVPMTPCFGGGYFRLFPIKLSSLILKRANRRGIPAIFYIHPWELDPEQPRVKLPRFKYIRHYINLSKTKQRINWLLSNFRFGSIGEVLDENNFI